MKSVVASAISRIHGQVKDLADALGVAIGLISSGQGVESGLMLFDLQARLGDQEPPCPGDPASAAKWRAGVDQLKARLEVATQDWNKELDGTDSCPRLLFARVATVEAAWGPLHSLSHHGLVIDGARLLFDPEAFAGPDGTWKGHVLRKRTVEHLIRMDAAELYFYLDREAALCIGKSVEGSAPELLKIDRKNETATWNGETYALSPRAMTILCHLIEARGGFVSSKNLKDSAAEDQRPDRIIERMPESIRLLIESKRGSGYRLTVPAVE